jgi:twinkle protein
MIVKPKDLIVQVTALYNGKLEKGVSTGWPSVDEFFTVKESEFTVVTGMPSHGKSEWLDALAVNLVMKHNYRIAIFSPENSCF